MDKTNEKPNPFLPSEKTTRSDSSDIFSGIPKQKFTKRVENPVLSQAIFENPSSSVQNVFDSSVPQRHFGMTQQETLRGGKETVSSESANLFGNVPTSTSNSGSSSFQGTNIFGGKIASTDPEDTLPSEKTSYTLTHSSTPKTSESTDCIFRGNESKSLPFNFKSYSTPILSEAFGTPSPVFSSQSKQSKDSKLANIFGGKQTQELSLVFPTTPEIRGFSQVTSNPISTFSKQGSKKASQMINESDSVRKTAFMSVPKPPLVFSSKFDKKFSENEQPNKAGISISSKLKVELSQGETAAVKIFHSEGKSHQTMSKQSSNIFHKIPQKKIPEDSCDPFDSATKELHSEAKSPRKESTMLIAVDIPSNFLDRSVLQTHFMKFGTVKKILINKKSNQASVYFTDHKSAAEAKAKGKRLHPLLPEMKLFFGAHPHSKKRSETVKKICEPVEPPSDFQQPPNNVEVNVQPPPSESAIEKNKSLAFPKKSEFRSKAPSGNLGSVKDFSVLMKSQAKNNYDRYLILDARDKSIRSKQKKVVDVKKAHYLLATCPDMCPEKERYSRDIQYDVSIYEMTDGEIDHRLAVKKFSRSSADKDEPLPHELRPGPVLKMTMNFLTSNIIGKGDEENVQIDLWYNYLCNRTRALRNDIMQQHLLDHNAVYVLERCTRFHIHCSHHLCEEPADYFDAKINAEHLTKSLQSLKELYHDMGEKGICYENEAEFRAYEILLCVNDGNVIFKYLKFRHPVRNSKEVQFAVKVLHSIHANNYVQFFKLLKEATYLQACIMHKYFTNVRLKALSIIVKAYSSQLLPVEKVMNMLGFSNESEFEKYIKFFGITVNEDSKVVINKSKFSSNLETVPPISKSVDMIMAKKKLAVREIVQNDSVPENPFAYYHPHNSFDSMGFLKQDALDAIDQNSSVDQPGPLRENETSIEDLDNEGLQKELYSKVEEMEKIKLLSKYFKGWKNFVKFQREKKQLDAEAKILVLKRITKVWKEKVAKTAELNRKADSHLLSKYFQKWETHIQCSKENKEYIKKAKMIERRILLRKLFNMWRSKTYFKKSVKKAKSAREYLLAHKFFTKWRFQTQASLAQQKSEQFYAAILMRSSFTQWQAWCAVKRKKKKVNFESFPAVGSQLSVDDQNKLLDWGYKRDHHLNMSAYQMLKINRDIHGKSRKHFSLQQLSGIVAWTALPLLHRFRADVNLKAPDFSENIFSTYFKFLLLTEPDTDAYLLEWIRTKFNILEVEDLSVPLHCQTQFTSRHGGINYTIIVSEKEFSFASKLNLDGASVVVLVANEDKLEQLNRFAVNVDKAPYLIMCKSESNELLHQDTWLMTKETIDNPLTSEKLFNFVFNLWQLRNEHYNLQTSKCATVVSRFVSKKVLAPIYHIVSQRKFYGKLTVCPSKVVEFYNAAITHAHACLEESKALACDWPPSEALSLSSGNSKLWNERDSRIITSAMQQVMLPPFILQLNLSWPFLEEHLAKYIKDVVSCDDWEGNLYSEVRKIIKESQRKLDENEMYLGLSSESRVFYHEIPWVDVLNCCIFFKLSRLPEVDVAYKLSDFESFDRNQRWISKLRSSEIVHVTSKTEETTTKRKAPPLTYSEPKKIKKIESRLLRDIEEEKRKAFNYENELKSLLLVEEELRLLFPNYDEASVELNC